MKRENSFLKECLVLVRKRMRINRLINWRLKGAKEEWIQRKEKRKATITIIKGRKFFGPVFILLFVLMLAILLVNGNLKEWLQAT